mmetsp:Transcript_102944/g.259412  ORF Transcript_102944/g.259412 Transcript_102944/m.259412 type:complete len:235 (+) Transcript_102944:142-846(+)
MIPSSAKWNLAAPALLGCLSSCRPFASTTRSGIRVVKLASRMRGNRQPCDQRCLPRLQVLTSWSRQRNRRSRISVICGLLARMRCHRPPSRRSCSAPATTTTSQRMRPTPRMQRSPTKQMRRQHQTHRKISSQLTLGPGLAAHAKVDLSSIDTTAVAGMPACDVTARRISPAMRLETVMVLAWCLISQGASRASEVTKPAAGAGGTRCAGRSRMSMSHCSVLSFRGCTTRSARG